MPIGVTCDKVICCNITHLTYIILMAYLVHLIIGHPLYTAHRFECPYKNGLHLLWKQLTIYSIFHRYHCHDKNKAEILLYKTYLLAAGFDESLTCRIPWRVSMPPCWSTAQRGDDPHLSIYNLHYVQICLNKTDHVMSNGLVIII